MLQETYHNESFIINKNNKKSDGIKNNLTLEHNLTPVKIIYNNKINYTTNIQKTKITNPIYLNNNKINVNNIKIKLLNFSNKNSRNISTSNGLNTNGTTGINGTNTKPTNYSLSFGTNFKTTFDINYSKTQNIKDIINNKDNCTILDSKTMTSFFHYLADSKLTQTLSEKI